jgi:hypothetical protein
MKVTTLRAVFAQLGGFRYCPVIVPVGYCGLQMLIDTPTVTSVRVGAQRWELFDRRRWDGADCGSRMTRRAQTVRRA